MSLKQSHTAFGILVSSIVLFIGAIYQAVSFINWLISYVQETGFSIWDEIFPLFLNSFMLIPAIFLFFVWRSNREINKTLFIFSIISSLVISIILLNSFLADDPLEAGLPYVLIGFPLGVAIIVLSFNHLKHDRER